MSQTVFIGRVAELHGLITKPELNGKFVMVESYNADNDRFGVLILWCPNSSTTSSQAPVSVKSANFTLCDPMLFQCNFSNPVVQRGNFSRNIYAPGTILEFTDVMQPPSTSNAPTESIPLSALLFYDSCRAIGAIGLLESGGQSLTKFLHDAIITNATDASVCIEFVNIDFTRGYVCPAGGKSVVFRNCRFGGESGLLVGDETVPTNVLIESCVFEGHVGKAAHITLGSKAVFLNCTFRDCQGGVNVGEGASAEVTHCTFIECFVGIEALAKADKLDVLNCTFEQGFQAYIQRNGCDATLKGCRFQSCWVAAISVEGPKRTVLHVEDCVVTDCRMGMGLRMGKIELTMVNTEITKSEKCGAILSGNLLGSVSFTNCKIKGNKTIDLINFCGPKSPVTHRWRVGENRRCSDERAASIFKPNLEHAGGRYANNVHACPHHSAIRKEPAHKQAEW